MSSLISNAPNNPTQTNPNNTEQINVVTQKISDAEKQLVDLKNQLKSLQPTKPWYKFFGGKRRKTKKTKSRRTKKQTRKK